MRAVNLLAMTCVAAASLIFTAAFAHHSTAMFESEKTTTLEGTVKEFQWTNPHIWLQLMVMDPISGKEVEWSIEGGSPNGLIRRDWSPRSAKPGDKAVVVIRPLKSGGPSGLLLTLTVDGKLIGNCPPESKALNRCE